MSKEEGMKLYIGAPISIALFREPMMPGCVAMDLYLRHSDGSTYMANPITMSKAPEDYGMCTSKPLLSLRDDQCQSLMDELHRLGFRPSDMPSADNALSATQYHLEDMRALTSRALKMALPLRKDKDR